MTAKGNIGRGKRIIITRKNRNVSVVLTAKAGYF